MCELKPAITSGKIYTQGGDFDCEVENKNGKIISIVFQNTGSNSIAVINYGGLAKNLQPGISGEGTSLSITMNSGYYDTTRYRISFNAGAGVVVNGLSISYIAVKKQ